MDVIHTLFTLKQINFREPRVMNCIQIARLCVTYITVIINLCCYSSTQETAVYDTNLEMVYEIKPRKSKLYWAGGTDSPRAGQKISSPEFSPQYLRVPAIYTQAEPIQSDSTISHTHSLAFISYTHSLAFISYTHSLAFVPVTSHTRLGLPSNRISSIFCSYCFSHASYVSFLAQPSLFYFLNHIS